MFGIQFWKIVHYVCNIVGLSFETCWDFVHRPGFPGNFIIAVPRPPYLFDIAQCDLYLFPRMKINLNGWRFETSLGRSRGISKIAHVKLYWWSFQLIEKLLWTVEKLVKVTICLYWIFGTLTGFKSNINFNNWV